MLHDLKIYQFKAKETLKEIVELAFQQIKEERITSRIITFKAPTGSGKTFIVSSLFETLYEDLCDEDYCIIWACPGKGDLHEQSYDAVKSYLGGNPLCSKLEGEFFGTREYIKNKEIVFVNWEKLIMKDRETGKWANSLMKDKEGQTFINVIDRTKRNGTKIILVVDESHVGSGNNARTRINEFRQTIIMPDICIQMSATPASTPDVIVDPQDVIDEGMIKRDVIVNEGISKDDRSLEEIDSEQIVLSKGYEKQQELIKRFKELNVNVNPLVLVQIPNTEAGEAKKDVIRTFLQEKGITETNGKLKLWCDNSGNFDKKLIKRNDDKTEYLIFKTAVATGWDCPRAHILIKFRDGHSETFETQTIGRILRTPEAKSYEDELLDNAYIFTNVKDFETKQDSYNPNRIKTAFAKMREGYNINNTYSQTVLESFYRSRMGDYNSADSRFYKYFADAFAKRFELTDKDKFGNVDKVEDKLTKKGLNLKITSLDQMIEETRINTGSVDNEQSLITESATVTMSENDAEAKYYTLISQNLNGLAYVRSKKTINAAIVDCLSTYYNKFPRNIKVKCYQQIFLNNEAVFTSILSEATLSFRQLLQENAGKKGDFYQFKFEESRPYSEESHCVLTLRKSLYKPFYVLKGPDGNPRNNLETEFLNYLDSQDDTVEWIWENGTDPMRINFGIAYNNRMSTFQPDFIVRFKNNTVGIFDTKAIGQRVEDINGTAPKALALNEYIEQTNSHRGHYPRLCGGIVVKKGSQFYLHSGKNYKDFDIDRSDWVNLSDFLFKINEEIKANNLKKK